MTTLNSKPSSSTKRQHQTLVVAGLNRGFDLAEIRRMVGGSLRRLSVQEASAWIASLSGKGLANPPGEKPKAYQGHPAPGTVRVIAHDHVDQIERLLIECFPNRDAARDWLRKNFKVLSPRNLATARRAGEVIRVLKVMLRRRST